MADKVYGAQYRTVWTKDAHGGAYRKAGASESGYDALVQRPDRSELALEPGYERANTGPTSNFVGNHMTQGAIDLVQSELHRPVHKQSKNGQQYLALTASSELPAREQGAGSSLCPSPAVGSTPAAAEEHLRRLRASVRRARTDADKLAQ